MRSSGLKLKASNEENLFLSVFHVNWFWFIILRSIRIIWFCYLFCEVLLYGISYRASGLKESEVKQMNCVSHSTREIWFIFFSLLLLPSVSSPWFLASFSAPTSCVDFLCCEVHMERDSVPCTLEMAQWHQQLPLLAEKQVMP